MPCRGPMTSLCVDAAAAVEEPDSGDMDILRAAYEWVTEFSDLLLPVVFETPEGAVPTARDPTTMALLRTCKIKLDEAHAVFGHNLAVLADFYETAVAMLADSRADDLAANIVRAVAIAAHRKCVSGAGTAVVETVLAGAFSELALRV